MLECMAGPPTMGELVHNFYEGLFFIGSRGWKLIGQTGLQRFTVIG
jgi:hypothetical protein